MFISDFSKYEICSESFTKTLYRQFFGKWMHFQIFLSLWELEVMIDLLCLYLLCWKIFEQIVTFTYLKKQQPEVICKKAALKNFAKFYRNQLCWSLFIIKLQAWGRCIPVKFAEFLRAPILKSICEPLHASASSVIFFTMHEKDGDGDGNLWWRFFGKTVNRF